MIRVLFFAGVRQAAGCDEARVAGGEQGLTGEELWEALGRMHPALARLAPSVRIACNHEYLAPGQRIFSGDEVALIPPVSGG